jgi:hypothetical protein
LEVYFPVGTSRFKPKIPSLASLEQHQFNPGVRGAVGVLLLSLPGVARSNIERWNELDISR